MHNFSMHNIYLTYTVTFWLISDTSFFFREFEPVRLLGLQLLGKLLTGIPSEKEGTKLFTLPLGKSRPISVNLTKEITAAPQLFLNTMSERLFKFPLSDNLCAVLFSVLSGTSAQQVIVLTLCHIVFSLFFFSVSPVLTEYVICCFLCIGSPGKFSVWSIKG